MDGGWLVSAYDMSERSAKERNDTLTKLGNRLMFHERLAEMLAKPDRTAEAAAVLVLDLARFKAINESLGRTISGVLLGCVADRIRAALGSGDIAARLGGDKFGIIQVAQGQPQSAAALAGLLVDLIGRSYTVEGHLIDVAANVGIVLLPTEATDCEQLLKNADLALHRAKCDGLGAYRFFERAMDERMQYRRNLEIDLRRALALGEFSLVYQPQVNLRQNKVTGFEALLRWQSPIRGAVSPFEFIPVAEETGIITSIGEWVLRTACLEAARWSGAQRVSVNVSAIQFKSPTLVATVSSALGESGLDPQRLELEVTESVMLDAGGPRSRCCRISAKSACAWRSMILASDIRRWVTCAIFHSTGSRSINPSFAAPQTTPSAAPSSAPWPRSAKASESRRSLKVLKPRSRWPASAPTAAPMYRAI
jgi:diguanylate cyclase (GGDEF)-like protein